MIDKNGAPAKMVMDPGAGTSKWSSQGMALQVVGSQVSRSKAPEFLKRPSSN